MKSCVLLLIGLAVIAGTKESYARSGPDVGFETTRSGRIMTQYGDIIDRASRLFDIPAPILVGVILTESDGDPGATTPLSSAKGLMQTIDATFELARNGLREKGISIADDPFDPESSILAGAWYLDRMYGRTVAENRVSPGKRHLPASWKTALEYYYAGPENGAKKQNRIRVCSRGKCRIIDKAAYSSKVLALAPTQIPATVAIPSAPSLQPSPVFAVSASQAASPLSLKPPSGFTAQAFQLDESLSLVRLAKRPPKLPAVPERTGGQNFRQAPDRGFD